MSRSNDTGHFFQTSDSLALSERRTAKAKNEHGSPIKLPSKILAAIEDPVTGGVIYVAEAAGEIKRVILETSKVQKIFSQGNAPMTCLAICQNNTTLFAGSWDKSIYPVRLGSKGETSQRLSGHTDFVKCLLATSLNAKPVLISGGADATIIVWDIESGEQLHKLKGHTKSLQDVAVDPLSTPEGSAAPEDSFTLYSASSDPEIRRWHISLDSAYELAASIEKPIIAHDTSVYRVIFDTDGDLWTASADKTAKHLARSREWEADTVLQHPDFVRDVILAEDLGLVITACRDEEVRLWDSSSGTLLCTYSGHYEEVTGLVLLSNSLLSVSIDGTIRRWGLSKEDMAIYQEELRREKIGEDSEATTQKAGMLTAEEEAELAELMEDDD